MISEKRILPFSVTSVEFFRSGSHISNLVIYFTELSEIQIG